VCIASKKVGTTHLILFEIFRKRSKKVKHYQYEESASLAVIQIVVVWVVIFQIEP
jgi:hypothetical protein